MLSGARNHLEILNSIGWRNPGDAVVSWCDKLAATPTVGFRVDYHYEPLDTVLRALYPMLNKWVDGDKARFTVEKREPTFTVNLNLHQDGFIYSVEPTRI